MFDSLKNNAGLESANLSTEMTISEEMLDQMVEVMADVPASRVARMQHISTKQELVALIGAIETFGLSRALLSFADYNGALRGAVSAIPALEALTEDLTPADSATVLTALKAINFDDAEPAEESLLLIAGLGAYGMVMFILSTYSSLLVMKGYRHWNTERDDKEGRLAKVVPFKFLDGHLKGLMEVPAVAKELAGMAPPKNKEEWDAFMKAVDMKADKLEMIGVSVEGEEVRVAEMPKAVKNKIDTLGYGETSLVDLVDAVEKVSDLRWKLDKTAMNPLYAGGEYDKLTKDERRYVDTAGRLVADVMKTSARRAVKILRETKTTINVIKGYYKS